MHFIEIAYLCGAVLSLTACIPQVRTLLAKKNAEEFNTTTWTMWLFTQIITLTYVSHFGSILMVITNICWVSFYAVMVCLILYFDRQQKRLQGEPERLEDMA